MEYIVGFIINFVDFFAEDNFISSFFKTDKTYRTKFILFIFRFITANIIFEELMQTTSVVKAVFVLLIDLFIFNYLYKTFKIIFAIIVWYVISSAFEFFCIACFVWVSGIAVRDIMNSVVYFTIFSVSFYLTLFIISVVFKYWANKNLDADYLSKNEYILLSLLPILNYSVVYIILYNDFSVGIIKNTSFLISVLLVVATVVFIYFIGEICNSNKSKQLLLVYEKEEQAKKEYMTAVQTAYETQRQLTHDYNREIATLKSILQLKDYEKLENYLDKLVGNSQRNKLVVLTHNTIIDAILNQKYTEASNQGVTIDFSLDNLTGLPVTDEDIVIILTNSIDNAITAAMKSKEKLVQIFISYEDDEFLYVVKNSTGEKVVIENNDIVKNKNMYHGYGISKIRKILKRYDSHMLLECTDNRFIFSLSINF